MMSMHAVRMHLMDHRLGAGRLPAAGVRVSNNKRRATRPTPVSTTPSSAGKRVQAKPAAVPAKLAVNESRGWNPQRMVREILHEDDRVIVLNKGYGMTVQVKREATHCHLISSCYYLGRPDGQLTGQASQLACCTALRSTSVCFGH